MFKLPNDQKWHDNLALITENLEISAGYIDPKLDDVYFSNMVLKQNEIFNSELKCMEKENCPYGSKD